MMQEVEVLKTIPELVCSYFSEEQFTLSLLNFPFYYRAKECYNRCDYYAQKSCAIYWNDRRYDDEKFTDKRYHKGRKNGDH